jgi:hypothetical protein
MQKSYISNENNQPVAQGERQSQANWSDLNQVWQRHEINTETEW